MPPRRSASIRRTRRPFSSADMSTRRRARARKGRQRLGRGRGLDARGGEPELGRLVSWGDDMRYFVLFHHLPVYELLGDWGLREELGFSPGQERRLREVAAKAEAEQAKIEDGLSKLPQKEQDAKRSEPNTWENLAESPRAMAQAGRGNPHAPATRRLQKARRSLSTSCSGLRTPPRLPARSAPAGSRRRSCGG